MNATAQYQVLARYNTWMNRHVYAAAHTLSEEARTRELGAFFGSVHKTLNHILLADRTWMTRFTEDAARFASYDARGQVIPVRALDQVLYADFEELERQRGIMDFEIQEWVSRLTDADLERTIVYRTMRGTDQEHPLWWALGHFFNHQTHHRGQVTTLLSQLGADPGVTDLIAMQFGVP